jgi:hypothetical protein
VNDDAAVAEEGGSPWCEGDVLIGVAERELE